MDLILTKFKGFEILQPRYGYHFSAEPFVLTQNLEFKIPKRIVDFGSGCGIISVIVALKNPNSFIYAIEKNSKYIDIIKKNFKINKINNAIVLRDDREIETNSIDYFISNPPYFMEGKFRLSKKYLNEKFESYGGEKQFILYAKRLLKSKGTLRFTFHSTRLIEIIDTLRFNKFGIKTIQPVYGNLNKKSPFVLVEAKFASPDYVEIKPPIVLSQFYS
ncbi:tRNA1(Val) (adenine(37)-N6)-methyltransferase [Hippea maritima]|uniref:Methyltransferase small n=1 Tax=Hippea maritima (strain ATCC 700847 / DSM 10411 / MH2) TaxID=760142 RepID=F2LW16_HIPMA|nr:methyltransferase [Hippea maritima]AEA33950.1 methyltransferase small [Hippea maritima DSM 10411]